jgi:hypothetical protein
MNMYCYISSMFRSGSTLIARMLDAHPQIASASDPMRPLFNSFRYDIASTEFQNSHHRFDPLGDYFLKDCTLLKKILKSSFLHPVGLSPFEMISAVAKRAEMFSGSYAAALDSTMAIETYKDYISYFLETIANIYGNGKQYSCVAFKEVWSTEFFPALKRSFPSMKCITIVRDPRAVVASKNATGEPYPYIFMGRQWRKLAWLSAYMDYQFEDVLLLRYEDIVSQPEEYVAKICRFLNVEYCDSLLDLKTYKDGRGNSWKQNSSYEDSNSLRISGRSLDKWKTILDAKDLFSIELFTHDWMQHFGYEPNFSLKNIYDGGIDNYKQFDQNLLAQWIRPFAFDSDEDRLANEFLLEKLRLIEGAKLCPDEKLRLHLKWWQ